MKYKVRVGVIGWIDPAGPWPMPTGANSSAVTEQLFKNAPTANSWITKSYMGLMATTNNPPSPKLDFHKYRATKDFRTMAWANLEFDDQAGVGPIHARYVGSEAQSLIVDAGYTPPVNVNKVGAMAMLVTMLTSREKLNREINEKTGKARDFENEVRRFVGIKPQPTGAPIQLPYGPLGNKNTLQHIQDKHWYQGELSPVSGLHRDKQHNNSVFPPIPAGERLIVNGVMRFRAGPHTDGVGIGDAQSDYHVPWVWAELLLTSLGGGRVRLRGASSIFPTVAWYLDDHQVSPRHHQVGDGSLPLPYGFVAPEAMRIWPVLSAGAPRGVSEPSRAHEAQYLNHRRPVTSLRWTCPGGPCVDFQATLKHS